MSQLLNIDPQKKDDMFYRYKMPAIVTKIEGSGNGIKTVFPNIRDVCAKLNRPPEVLNKFFGYELGAQSTFLKNDDKFLVMGSHTQQRIQDRVYEFISRLVLCKQCRNPETDPHVEGKGRLLMLCRSCGKDTEIVNERIQTFMTTYYTGAAKVAPKAKTEGGKPADGDASAVAPAAAQGDSEEPVIVEKSSKPVKIETTSDQLQRANPIVALADFMKQVPQPAAERVVQKIIELKTENNLSDALGARLLWRAMVDGIDGAKLITTMQQWLEAMQLVIKEETLCQALLKELAKTCYDLKVPHKFPMGVKLLWEEGILPEAEATRFVESYKPSGKEVSKEFVATLQANSRPLVQWLAGESF
jgi:translation initiation factor 5